MTTAAAELLGAPGLVRLVDRLEQRLRRGRPLDGSIALTAVTADEQAAIARLLGRPVGVGRTASVPLGQVEDAVRISGAGPDLAAAVEALRGPLRQEAEALAVAAVAWGDAIGPLDDLAARRPVLAGFAAGVRRDGTIRRGAAGPEAAAALVRDLVAVLDALPAGGEPLPAFAARVLQDAHALDRGPLRTLAERALPDLAGLPREGGSVAERWAAAGVALDALSSSVLVHGVRFVTGEPVGAALDAVSATGQPALVTLRMLLAGARPVASEVFVCENPAVVAAAADEHGTGSAPLVCVRGQPSAAAQRLLRLLADSGCVLRYHGDFDWGGIRIANRIVERFGAGPWRFGTPDYLAYVGGGRALTGTRVEAVWDPDLASAVAERGTRLEEEQVLAPLLADLGA